MYDLRQIFPDLADVSERKEILIEFLAFMGIDITYGECVALPGSTLSHLKKFLQNLFDTVSASNNRGNILVQTFSAMVLAEIDSMTNTASSQCSQFWSGRFDRSGNGQDRLPREMARDQSQRSRFLVFSL